MINQNSTFRLPPGTHIFVWLPKGTTPQELSDFFYAQDLPIDVDRISIRHNVHHNVQLATGMISIPAEIIADLLTWLLAERPFNGSTLKFERTRTREEREALKNRAA